MYVGRVACALAPLANICEQRFANVRTIRTNARMLERTVRLIVHRGGLGKTRVFSGQSIGGILSQGV